MSGILIVPELARAWQQYFRTKGGQSPAIPSEIVPVVIMDDNRNGPYPAHRRWQYGSFLGAAAALFSYVAVRNNDAPDQNSACVVDEIFVNGLPAIASLDWRVGVMPLSLIGLTNDPTRDVILQKDPQSVLGADPQFSNVMGGAGTNGSLNTIINSYFPGGGPNNVSRIPGPFVIGPQQVCVVFSSVQNQGLVIYFRGRYYPAT